MKLGEGQCKTACACEPPAYVIRHFPLTFENRFRSARRSRQIVLRNTLTLLLVLWPCSKMAIASGVSSVGPRSRSAASIISASGTSSSGLIDPNASPDVNRPLLAVGLPQPVHQPLATRLDTRWLIVRNPTHDAGLSLPGGPRGPQPHTPSACTHQYSLIHCWLPTDICPAFLDATPCSPLSVRSRMLRSAIAMDCRGGCFCASERWAWAPAR